MLAVNSLCVHLYSYLHSPTSHDLNVCVLVLSLLLRSSKDEIGTFLGSMSVSHTTVTLCWLQPFSSSFNKVVLLL